MPARPDRAQQQGLLDNMATQVPPGSVDHADEVANAAMFLASDAASFVNGIDAFVGGDQAQV